MDGVDSVAAVGVVVPVAATVVDIAVGVVALLRTRRCGSAMQISQTSPHLDAINPQGQLGIGEDMDSNPTTLFRMSRGTWLPSFSFSYLSQRNMNWLVSVCHWVQSHLGCVCVALELWVKWDVQ